MAGDITLYTTPVTWETALTVCNSQGQNLVQIYREAKNHLLKEHLLDHLGMHIWIGLYAPNPSDNTNRIWSDDGSPPSYENWSPSKTEGAGYLCTYIVVENTGLEWNLADCDTEKKSFMCEEDKSICTTGIYYTYTQWRSGSFSGSFYISPATVPGCINTCESIIANGYVCWGFVYRVTTDPNACLTYDSTDDPYYNIINQQYSGNHYNYIRNCNLTIHVRSHCSACFPTTPHPTTLVQTTTEDHTTEIHTTTEDHTTRVHTTTEEVEMTEDRITTIKDDTTTEYRTTVTTGEKTTQTTPEIGTSNGNQTRPGGGIYPYCTCTCQNVTTTLSLEESIQEIVNNIKVDKRKMSSHTRKLTSAKDSRPSSASIGYFGIVMLSTTFGILVFLDFHRLIDKCCTIFKPLKDQHSSQC
ncbi:CD206 [Mytilus edulis]|uniref:MRC n=1 Tax=Mytilus edulis TaxID=6550 RepID=A0A8S3S9Y8_MYTED|nr:CD206 [Mytilus edulis]